MFKIDSSGINDNLIFIRTYRQPQLLGSFLLLLLLLGTFITRRSLSSGGFLFLLFLLFLLLVHGSGNKEVDDRFGQNITVVVVLELSEDVVQFIDGELVSEGGQNMDKVVLIENVTLNNLSFNLLLHFFIKSLKCIHNHVIRIVDTSSHLGSKHLDHVVV